MFNFRTINKVSCEKNSVKTVSENLKTISNTIELLEKFRVKVRFLEGEGCYELTTGRKFPVTYRAFLKYPMLNNRILDDQMLANLTIRLYR